MYSEKYSGADPVFDESDVFRITVPLNDEFSWDAGKLNDTVNDTVRLNESQTKIISALKKDSHLTQEKLSKIVGISLVNIIYPTSLARASISPPFVIRSFKTSVITTFTVLAFAITVSSPCSSSQ